MTASDEYAELPEREQRLIDDVYRHWVMTADLAGRRLCPDIATDAVRMFLAGSAERGWLARHAFTEHEPYFVLGQRAIAALGVRRSAKALGHQALLEHYAVLLACTRRQCAVITEEEFRSQFPDLSEPGLSAKNFFIDRAHDPVRLGLFVVDHDKLTSRLVGKVRRRVGRILATDRPAFRRLVLDGHLAVSVVTATEGKRANLEAAFARKPLRTVTVTVEAHPELEDLFLVKRR
ncbi:MAG: hypothetical protein K2X91_16525 [Thermoleophilia bacterium]|nr:hypothetical protein [Thermoleophilia bacterium]